MSARLLSPKGFCFRATKASNTIEKDWGIKTQTPAEVGKEVEERQKSGDKMAFAKSFYMYHILEGYGSNYSDKLVDMDGLNLP